MFGGARVYRANEHSSQNFWRLGRSLEGERTPAEAVLICRSKENDSYLRRTLQITASKKHNTHLRSNAMLENRHGKDAGLDSGVWCSVAWYLTIDHTSACFVSKIPQLKGIGPSLVVA